MIHAKIAQEGAVFKGKGRQRRAAYAGGVLQIEVAFDARVPQPYARRGDASSLGVTAKGNGGVREEELANDRGADRRIVRAASEI